MPHHPEIRSRRVLIFSLAYEPRIGGAEIAVREITGRLPGYEFDLVTLALDSGLPYRERIGSVRVFRVGGYLPRFLKLNKLLFPFAAAFRGLRLHRARPYDIVWSIMANYAGFAALFFKKMHPEVPFLLTLQEGDPIEHILRKTRFVSRWFRQIFSRADMVQAISQYLADFGISMGARAPAVVVPNGVHYEYFHRTGDASDVQALRERFTDRGTQLLLITVSRLVQKNAVDVIIQALSHIGSAAKLLVVGTGPEHSYLVGLAAELGVLDRVLFLGDIPHGKLPTYLQLSDVFVRPSRSEGMGNAFIEAMAAGVPVVATTVGGIADFLRDGENGVVVPVDDPVAVAEGVRRITEDEAFARRIIAGGDITAREYDWKGIAEDMDTVFKRLLA